MARGKQWEKSMEKKKGGNKGNKQGIRETKGNKQGSGHQGQKGGAYKGKRCKQGAEETRGINRDNQEQRETHRWGSVNNEIQTRSKLRETRGTNRV